MPHLLGEDQSAPHATLFWRRSVAAAVRDGDWKLVRVQELDGSFREPLLVDLAAHPGETVNVAAEHPKLVQELLAKLASWEAELMAPRWLEGARWEKNQRLKHQFELQGRAAERRFP